MNGAPVTLASGEARVRVVPHTGGALASFEWRGHHVLRPTSDDDLAAGAVRRFACFPLVPFSNRIADATLRWGGGSHALRRYVPGEPHAIHGNAWQRSWTLSAVDAASATLELDHRAGNDAHEWPFPYRAVQRVALADNTLTVSLEITNTGDERFPFGLGWHPYFPRDDDTELAFSARTAWRTDQTRLPTEPVDARAFADFSASRRIGDTALDNCFAGWTPPATVSWPREGIAARIDADAACDHLVVFIPPGKDFLALEPVTHMTDAFNRAGVRDSPWCRDTGQRILAPGERFSCTMRISVGRLAIR